MANPWDNDVPVGGAPLLRPSAPAWANDVPVDQPAIDNSPNELGVPVFNKAQSHADLDRVGPLAKGKILPISYDHDMNRHFDMSAGIPGALMGALNTGGGLAKQAMTEGSQSLLNDPSVAGRAMEAAAPFSPMGAEGRVAMPGLRGFRPGQVVPPTAKELKAAGAEGFNALRDLGVDYASPAVSQMAMKAKAGLDKEGLISENAPNVHKILDKLINAPEGSVAGTDGLIAARRAFQAAAAPNTPEAAASPHVVRAIDDFLRNPGEGNVVAGPAERVSPILEHSNANYAAGKRTETLDDLTTTARRRAQAANSGKNEDNSVRGRLVSLLDNKKKMRGFSDDEKGAIEGVISGNKITNALRRGGNLLGGGGGLGQIVPGGIGAGLGAALGGPVGAAIGGGLPIVAGALMKNGENALSRKAIEALSEKIRSRSPLAEQMQQNAPGVGADPARYNAIIRALLLSQQNQAL